MPSKTPQPPPSFTLSPAEILSQTTDLISNTTALEDSLVSSLTPSTATFSSLLTPILKDDHAVSKKTLLIRLFSSVSEDKDLRDASRTAEEMLLKANSAALMRKDVASLVKAVYEKSQRGEEKIDEEDAYMLFKTHRAYQNTGAGIEDEALRETYKTAVQERNEVLIAAKKTISESDDGIYFTRSRLNGVPSSILDAMEVNDKGELKATFKKGHLISIMKHATSASTRKAFHIAKESRFPENVTRLERAVELRNSTARMLGFKTHAELKMEDKMAKNVESVIAMLNKLRVQLKPLADEEMRTLFEIKKAYIQEHGTDEAQEDSDKLNAWDWAFYARILEKERYFVDSLLISDYFEVNHSLEGMLRIFEEIFGMVFIPIDAPVWQKDVTVYEAWNSEDQGGDFLGYLYLDLYAREGKYAGAHSSLIQPGFITSDSQRHYPSSSLVTSLLHSPGRPTLLLHSELKTMFHELGHAIHKLVTHTKHQHGCSRDFVEIPSILLENWIWVPSVLRRLGKHYSYLSDEYLSFWKTQKGDLGTRPDEEIPEKLTLDLARTKHVNGAHAMLHQVFLALFDLTIHNADEAHPVDTTKLWNESKTEIMGLGRADSIGQASFAHPFRGYDAAYFTYALSKVYATDLWVSYFKADPMDKKTGLRYRQHVLQPGGSQPELNSLSNFLGREPNDEAYYSEVTLGSEAQKPAAL
ncbi:prd1-proteinase yscd [Fusarium langsethiae]|uniref:Prd1-proteinase yscd n=1 Tax=Fusarium langsethiae TaxID=179993 RepID=A0A0M9EU10_FUSLA|nr:prd1-proteinase yscd [Fusarium langsethiae]GKU05161.1 unnamed protein product [Fusarium langsethiae]GKU21707.1 unnamed protein product [Fusarium langsethiae]